MDRAAIADYATIISFLIMITGFASDYLKNKMLGENETVKIIILIFLISTLILNVINRFGPVISRKRELVINYAGWGLGFDRYVDVTNKIRRKIKSNTLTTKIDVNLLEDPFPNIPPGKHLLVIYSHGTHQGEKIIVNEHGWLKLP